MRQLSRRAFPELGSWGLGGLQVQVGGLQVQVAANTAALQAVGDKFLVLAAYVAEHNAYKRLWWWQRGKPPTLKC